MGKFKKIAAVATAGLAFGAAPALADNHEWVMDGSEFPEGKVKGITYGDGLFVTAEVRCQTTCFKYSSNGKDWQVADHPAVSGGSYQTFSDVEYGDGNFVAVGGGIIFYSEDGKEWFTANRVPSSVQWNMVTYNEEKDTWVVAESSGDEITYSTDGGKTWSAKQPIGVSNTWTDIGNNGETYVLAASYGSSPYRSQFVYLTHDDMLAGRNATITMSSDFPEGQANYLSKTNWGFVNWNVATQKWVVVSGRYNNTAGIAESEDGINWTTYTNPFGGNYKKGISVGDEILHVGSGAKPLTVNPNDVGNPKAASVPGNAAGMEWQDVAYGNGMYVAVAYGPNNSVGRTMHRGEVVQLPEVPEDVLPENPVIIEDTTKPIALPNDNDKPVYFSITPFAPATPTWDPNARGACERSETNKKLVKCVSGMTKLPGFTGLYTLKANLSGTAHKMKGACRWDGDDSECRVYLNKKGKWRLTWGAGDDRTTARTVVIK